MNLPLRCLLGAFLLSGALPLQALQPASVETDIAISELAGSTMAASGVVVSLGDAMLASELEGRLTWVAEVGDQVKQGDPVAVLDDHLLSLDKQDAEAAIARLEANLQWLERQAGRLEKLAATNNTAESELDEVLSRHRMMEQELAGARLNLRRRDYDLQRSRILAPFDGVVAGREMSAGEYAEPGQGLIRLVDTASAEVAVTAPLRLARFVKPGDLVRVYDAERETLSPVRGLVPVGDERSHMMEVRVSLPGGDWLIGEAVSVALPESRAREQVTVSRDALILRDRQTYLFTIGSDAVARRVDVTIGEGRGDRITVEGNVKPGARVVVRGGENLRDGQPVKVIQQALSSR